MALLTLLSIGALAASIVLLMQLPARLFPVIAAVASGVQVLKGMGMIQLAIKGLPLGLILGAALAVAGVGSYAKATAKTAVAAATVVSVVGVLQVLKALHLLS